MISLSEQIISQYQAYLAERMVAATLFPEYRKWLRYYLDYCHRYREGRSYDDTISGFIEKLRQKNQSDQQRQQALQAVKLYHGMLDRPAKQKDSIPPPLNVAPEPSASYRPKAGLLPQVKTP